MSLLLPPRAQADSVCEMNEYVLPQHANALGNVFGGLERYEEAVACFRKALAIDPQMAETCYCLGNALITLGRIDEGRQAFEAAIALAPGRPDQQRRRGADDDRRTAQLRRRGLGEFAVGRRPACRDGPLGVQSERIG